MIFMQQSSFCATQYLMAESYTARAAAPRRRRRRRFRIVTIWPRARTRRRAIRAFRAAPFAAQVVIAAITLLLLWFFANGLYQVIRKPTELYFPVSGVLNKPPAETWRSYEPIFREHATPVITPEFLAALAQVESTGNPVARTYWRWQWSWNPLKWYRPASSAVGMYQITDATFIEAKRYCIHGHVVVEDGPWHDVRSCWFNSLYTRVVPTHAVELTSALLDRQVARSLERYRIKTATIQQKQDLGAMIHLCGAGAGDAFAKRGFRLAANQKCGDHDASDYLARVNAMKRLFTRFASAE